MKMVLQIQGSASHNTMRGQRVRHPASTNFDDDPDFKSPTAKRVKRRESTDSSISRIEVEEDDFPRRSPSRVFPREIADSEADRDEEDESQSGTTVHKTNLESALPPVKTGKEAVADYEAIRATEETVPLDLRGRLGQRSWVKGKSSIYVDAFNLALETVLEDESHLFDEAEMAVFEHWKDLSYEAQFLYVRLFLRKNAAWHRVIRLKYFSDIADMPGAIQDLLQSRPLPKSTAVPHAHPGEFEVAQDTVLKEAFAFADGSTEHITTLEDASKLLMLDELKIIAKEVKVQGKNKRELTESLRKTSSKQGGLGWSGLKRSDTEESLWKVSEAIEVDENGEEINLPNSQGVSRDDYFVKKILENTGLCVRLSPATLKLFERVHLVFYRSTEWTEKSLTTIILARMSKRNFPDYIVSRSTNIFPSRSALLEFEASIRTQFQVDSILEMNGTVQRDGLQKVKYIFEEVYPRWQALTIEEQLKEERVYENGEGAYLRRFSPGWVYTRIVHKGLYPFARFKEHKREHQLLVELLDQRLFHAARRGAWYQRKALLEEHYMWALSSAEGRSEEAQKKHWKRVALQTCEEALQDNECHITYHYDLQKRISKLEKSLKVVKREQHDFGHVTLVKPVERIVEGIRIEKDLPLPPGRNGLIRRASDGNNGPRRGGKTIWVDEREGGGECSVEAMCLSWYRDQGWKGYHSEGRIVRTLFGYLFYDILFTYVPNVFQTPYQTCPLDLHTDAFFASRASLINNRLAEIANGGAEGILKRVWDAEHEKETCVVGIDWAFEIEDLIEIVQCYRGQALATTLQVMAQEYQQRGGGIPDLFLWNMDRKEVMFSEVKSENDRLSDTQRLWIHVLTGAGVKVELCNAVAREVREG